MISFETACKHIYDRYVAWGYPGICGAGDVGAEWVFLQGVGNQSEDYPIGPKPIFYDKKTGEQRAFDLFNHNDVILLKNATKMKIPDKYYAQ